MSKDFISGKYVYSSQNEFQRQSSQAKIMQAQSLKLIAQARPIQGLHLLDFGCGSADLTFSLLDLVGPAGKILGVDGDPALVHGNKARIDRTREESITFQIGSVENCSTLFNYDISYARFLMAHAKNPINIIKNMMDLTKNYGHVVLEDVDIQTLHSDPWCQELETLKSWVAAIVQFNGGNASIGTDLGLLMQEAGLTNVRLFNHQPRGSSGAIKQIPYQVLQGIKSQLLKAELATPNQITQLETDLNRIEHDRNITLYFPVIYQAIGHHNKILKMK